jgi:segregation and condensation protein B
MDAAELKGALEAIIYAADEPATLDQLAQATGAGPDEVRAMLDEMIGACGADERGIEIRRVARGYRYSTKPRHHEVVRKFIKSLRPPVRLSMPALETLAVIAYRQPITLPEIQEIRGVNASGVIQTLLDKRLVTTAGRKSVIGRPILYRTTKEFLIRFGLEDMDDLPSLKDFEQLAREALGPDAGIEMGPLPVSEGEPSGGEEAAADAKTEAVRESAAGADPESEGEAADTRGPAEPDPDATLANSPAAPEPDSAEPSESG